MADFSAWYVETTDLNELEVVNIKEGQQVEIRPDALENLVLTGPWWNVSANRSASRAGTCCTRSKSA